MNISTIKGLFLLFLNTLRVSQSVPVFIRNSVKSFKSQKLSQAALWAAELIYLRNHEKYVNNYSPDSTIASVTTETVIMLHLKPLDRCKCHHICNVGEGRR